jgi:hypothetical protein
LREEAERLTAAQHWQDGDLRILIVADTGYDVARRAFLPPDLPVVIVGRVRTDRSLQSCVPCGVGAAAARTARQSPLVQL